MSKIINGETEMDYKWFSAKIKYKGVCPNCGAETEYDFNSDSIEYPKIGQIEEISVGCQECDADIILPIKIHQAKVDIEFFEEQIRIE